MYLRTVVLLLVLGWWFPLASSLGQEFQRHEIPDGTKCRYMLFNKESIFPATLQGYRDWKIGDHVIGDFKETLSVPRGKWLWLSMYGVEKSQRKNNTLRVNLAPLANFQDGDLCIFSCGPVYQVVLQEEDLVALARFSTLQGLGFEIDKDFKDASVLKQFKKLDSLGIRDPHQQFWKAKEAAATLSSMGHLRSLTLNGSPCDDGTMPVIGELKKLESLHLSNVSLSDKGLKSIQSITSLREILLDSQFPCNPGITDEGFADFSKLKKLESLDIGATNVSDKAVEALRAKFPNANISVGNRRPEGTPAPIPEADKERRPGDGGKSVRHEKRIKSATKLGQVQVRAKLESR